jgi:peptidoglycan/xylan/chitin deacetylase (PgdA/CDA1 family)
VACFKGWSDGAVAAFETVMRLGLEGVHRLRLDGLARRMLPCGGVIFALHRVQPASAKSFAPNRLLEVTPEFLEETIKTVRASGFDIISLDTALHRLASAVERPFACFTFDDAYKDNKDYAAPILIKHGVPFTIYVPEHFADGTGQLWWVELELAVAACSTLAVPEVFQHEKLACATGAEKTEAYRRIYWRLRQMDEVAARAIVRRLCLHAGVDVSRLCSELIMSWDELRELGKNPHVTFGAHTIGHYAVAKLHPAQALHEMAASKARIEAELGRECRHFCYPYGDAESAGDRDFLLAQKAGFASAVTMRKGLIGTSQTANLMALPRCSLNGNYQDQRYVTALLSGLPFFLWNGLFERHPALIPSRGLRPVTGGGQS